jgi:protein SCO1/2
MGRAATGILIAVFGLAQLSGCAWLMEDPVSVKEAPRPERRSLYAYPWVWTDEQGQRVRLSRWRGQPLVVTAIFATCREVCPRTVKRLRELDERFTREGLRPRFVLVTLDPVTDTPERLRKFKLEEKLPASWTLLGGASASTRQLTEFLEIHVVDLRAHMIHDAKIVVFDADGVASRKFSGWGLEEERL